MIEFIDHTNLFSVEKMRAAGEGHETEQLLKLQMQFKKRSDAHVKGKKQSELHRETLSSELVTAFQRRHLGVYNI